MKKFFTLILLPHGFVSYRGLCLLPMRLYQSHLVIVGTDPRSRFFKWMIGFRLRAEMTFQSYSTFAHGLCPHKPAHYFQTLPVVCVPTSHYTH